MELNKYIEMYYEEVDEIAKKHGGKNKDFTMEQFLEMFAVPMLVRQYKLNLKINELGLALRQKKDKIEIIKSVSAPGGIIV